MKSKKVVALLLAVLMVVALLPMGIFTASAGGKLTDEPFVYYQGDSETSIEWEGNSELPEDLVIPATDPDGLPITSIRAEAFSGSQTLKSVTIPETVKIIGEDAFYGCENLKNIYIAENSALETIRNSAFGATKIESLIIPEGVKSVGNWLVSECGNLKEVYIPSTVESIGGYIFELCTSLESVVVSAENTTYDSRDNCNAIIETASNKLISATGFSTLPTSLKIIGDGSFCNLYNIESLAIPYGVETLEKNSIMLPLLKTLSLPDTITSIDGSAIANCKNLTDFKCCGENEVFKNFVNNTYKTYVQENPTRFPGINVADITYTEVEHIFDTFTASSNGTHTCTCKVCKFVIDPTACDFKYKETISASCTVIGGELYACTKCDNTEMRNIQEKLPHSFICGICTVCGAKNDKFEIDSNWGELFEKLSKCSDFIKLVIEKIQAWFGFFDK